MSAPMSAEQITAAARTIVDGGPVPTGLAAEDVAPLCEAVDRLRAERDADRAAAITPHLLRPPAKRPGPMSGTRYFNLMRAIENEPDRYADYRPTTACGAPRTTEDLTVADWRSWLRREPQAAAARGVCPACLEETAKLTRSR